MNKEIKKEFKIILSDLYDAGKQYGEELGYTKDDVLYEMRLNALAHSMIKLEAKLQQAYLQGAKDMREVMKLELIGAKECATIFNVGDKLKDLCEVTYNKAILDINSKAQQFIDSLEKENDTYTAIED